MILIRAFILLIMSALLAPSAVQAQTATLQPSTGSQYQSAASVILLTPLKQQGDMTVKLFGMAGGDPAANGIYTFIAFYESPAEGWRIFQIGDFADYKLISEKPGNAVIEVRQDFADDGNGQIGTVVRRLSITWVPGTDGMPPATVQLRDIR